ncbi:hypothetical protein DMN91_008988 [Ooceraea biroi]|uniref:Uncharacterized protein n=1 Tax=Ooceraea biroi TaxID=2015173 RepID=A0A3L8DE81_OOCBI|nr:hypothetical protein DMN91_008988 [Ooceraea biroi]
MAYKRRSVVDNVKRRLTIDNREACYRLTGFLFPFKTVVILFNSIHFKIHVPEIINHEVHTKTVFIHLHKPGISVPKRPKPKPKEEAPKTYHKESHDENWSSWSTYGYHSDHDAESGNALSKDHADRSKNNDKKATPGSKKPFVPHHRDAYSPGLQHEDKPNYLRGRHGDGMMGYSYPPQYAVQEDVRETDHNGIEPYMHAYEEGYQKGGESASGHIYSGDLTKFYDEKHEEGDHSVEEYANESKEKTHAGRYFVDDAEYRRDNERKFEAEKHSSSGTLGSQA